MDTKIVFMRFLKSIVLLSVALFSTSLFAYDTKNIALCIGQNQEEVDSLCQDFNRSDFFPIKKIVPFSFGDANYKESIIQIQEAIRNAIAVYQSPHRELSHIFITSKGFLATLTAIAQNNLHRYYRTHISGLILHDPWTNLVSTCDFYGKKPQNELCDSIRSFTKALGGRASVVEVATSLSLSLQADWFWPKTLLINSDDKVLQDEARKLVETFAHQDIQYMHIKVDKQEVKTIQKRDQQVHLFIEDRLRDVTSKLLEPKPTYFGPVLRYHLYKIAYEPKQKLKMKFDIPYGKEPLQTYDLFVKEGSQNNPLFIYVHGGGWSKGDKISFEDVCKQYADKGYTAISINYRLLELPKVGMKEIVADVQQAIKHVFTHAKTYQANSNQTIIAAESAGAQLAFMAVAKLDKEQKKKIKATVLNSMTSDLTYHPKKKQIRLFGIENDNKRLQVIEKYSPVNYLEAFSIPSLAIHSINDRVVPPIHLEDISVKTVIHHDNIEAFWIDNGSHPIAPGRHSLEPGYQFIEEKIVNFEKKHLNTNKYKKN